jgi:hypothetical protein
MKDILCEELEKGNIELGKKVEEGESQLTAEKRILNQYKNQSLKYKTSLEQTQLTLEVNFFIFHICLINI